MNYCRILYFRYQDGVTLLELMTVIAIVAILATIAVPNFQVQLKNNRVASLNNELVALLTFARSEAVRRSVPVTVQLNIESATDWNLMVLNPETGDEARQTSNNRIEMTTDSTEQLLVFNSRGYLALEAGSPDDWNPTGVHLCFKHVSAANERQQRVMHILPTGQINVETKTWAVCPP